MAKPGRKPKGEFGIDERTKFLELLRGGFGINLALRELKTNHRRYQLSLKKIRGFRREVKSAIACCQESLVSLRYAAAMEGDARAQEYLISRNDRARQFEREMRMRGKELAAKNPAKDGPAATPIDEAIARRIMGATTAGDGPGDEPT